MDMDNARDLVQREALRHMKMGRFALSRESCCLQRPTWRSPLP